MEPAPPTVPQNGGLGTYGSVVRVLKSSDFWEGGRGGLTIGRLGRLEEQPDTFCPSGARTQKLNQQCKGGCVTCRPTGPLRFLSASQACEDCLKRAVAACAANASQTQKQAWESTSHSRRHLATQAAPPPDHLSTMGNNGPDHPNAPRQSEVEVPPPSPRSHK